MQPGSQYYVLSPDSAKPCFISQGKENFIIKDVSVTPNLKAIRDIWILYSPRYANIIIIITTIKIHKFTFFYLFIFFMNLFRSCNVLGTVLTTFIYS